MNNFLVIAGISGTGKTILRDRLVELYPDIFYSCPQVTTRPIRENESIYNYVFLNKSTYDLLDHLLIGKTEINGNFYGSLYNVNEDKIGIIILNELGLRNFNKIKESNTDIISVSIGLDKNIDDLEVEREGRDKQFLEDEKKVLSLCDVVITLDKDKWAEPSEIKDIVMNQLSK